MQYSPSFWPVSAAVENRNKMGGKQYIFTLLEARRTPMQHMQILNRSGHLFSSIRPPVLFNSAGCSLNSATYSHEFGHLVTGVS